MSAKLSEKTQQYEEIRQKDDRNTYLLRKFLENSNVDVSELPLDIKRLIDSVRERETQIKTLSEEVHRMKVQMKEAVAVYDGQQRLLADKEIEVTEYKKHVLALEVANEKLRTQSTTRRLSVLQ